MGHQQSRSTQALGGDVDKRVERKKPRVGLPVHLPYLRSAPPANAYTLPDFL